MNIVHLLTALRKSNPEKSAIIFKDQNITFQDLARTCFKLANGLKSLGIKKGDRVAIYFLNEPEYIYSYLATWACGATAVPLDYMLTEDELVSCISNCQAKALIARPKPIVSLAKIKESCQDLKHIIAAPAPQEANHSFEELIKNNNEVVPSIDIQNKDYAIIFYTSGTTGKPKGVLINYQQLDAPTKAMGYFVNNDVKNDDKTYCVVPFSHLGGLIYIQAMLVYGTTMVLAERFIPSEFLKAVQQFRINWFWLVPSMYYAILQSKDFESFDLSSLRWIVIFGAPSSPSAIRRFHNHCPKAELYHGWGLTETNAPTTVIPSGSSKIESVGKPAPWIQVKIVDDKEKDLAQGQTGEIVVRGWVVTEGYYKDPELTEQTFRSGWFHTGDLGKFDSEGYLYIMGRKKEMIKVAGEIVFEPEVEDAIHKHPLVAEAAVVGVPDKLRGEVPKAFVVFKDGKNITEEDLRFFLRQHLGHFKIPHYFEFLRELPKNRTGKIDKEKLRKEGSLNG